MRIVQFLINQYNSLTCRHHSKAAVEQNKPLISRFPINLTLDEKKEIDDIWGFFPVKREWNYMYASTFKATRGFDRRFVPSCCCYPYIIRALNRTKEYEILEHKGLTSLYLKDIRQPFAPLRSIHGVYYDADFKPLKDDVWVDYLADINSKEELIVKQAVDSSCGKNIQFIPIGSSRRTISEVLRGYKEDVVVQTILKQSASTSILNPTSVNTFRVSTLNLNGHISVVSILIKAGGKGNKVDNIGGGHGGIMTGVNDDGRIITESFNAIGEPVKLQFDEIPKYDISKLKEFAINAHRRLPQLGLVGWDIALDEEDQPVMIEANMHWPGITIEQLVGGPFFADRTDEVLQYVRRAMKIS